MEAIGVCVGGGKPGVCYMWLISREGEFRIRIA